MPAPEEDRRTLRQPGRIAQPQALSDDLIKKVTDRVYAMLMQDLRIERERHPPSSKGMAGRGGW